MFSTIYSVYFLLHDHGLLTRLVCRGRYFDEATLPDRPDFASLIPPKRPTTHQVGLGSLTNKRNDARDSHLRLSPSRELQGSPKEKDAHPEDTTHGDGDLRSRSSRNQSPSTNSQADGRKQRLSDAPNTESRSERQNDGVSGISKAAQSSIGSLKGQSGDTAVEDEHTGLMEIDDSLGLDDAGPESSHAMLSIGGSSVSRPLATQPSQSPGVTIHTQEEDCKNAQRMVPTVFGEQASSPNSTVGHHSSNTPGATAVSPDTSPESDFLDEEMEAMETAQAVANKEKPSDLEDTDSHTFDRQKDGHSHTQDSGPSASDNMMVDQSPPSKLSPTSALKSQPSSIDQSTSVNKTIGTADQNASQDLQAKAAATNEASQRLPARTTGPNQFQRPSMTIDTRVGSTSTVGDATLSQTAGSVQDGFVDSPLSIGNSATPRRAHAVSISASSPPERMTTRVSSGAIRHKSVSEILGGPPKPSPSQTEKSGPEKASTDSSKANSATDASGAISGRETPEPGAIRLRHPDRREKERERSKLSTVVFAKPQAERMEGNEFAVRDSHQPQNEEKDYLYSLFVSQAYGPPRCPPLRGLLSSAHKTLTTANACLDLRDQQDAKIMKRIYQLQYSNRWPLRQQERSNEPPRPKSHWDYVLDEVKWMRTDFREERKWKLVAAKQCADWCAEFAACNPEQQALLRVKTKPHVSTKAQNDVPDEEMADDAAEARAVEDSDDQLQHTPELVPSAAADTPSDSPVEVLPEYEDTIAPAAIFSLSSEEVVFDIRRSPVTEKLLDELPLYEPFKIVPDTDDLSAVLSPDASWKKDIVPISRFVESKIRIQEHKPPKKRSRYEYELDDEDKSHPQSKVLALSPEQTDVALFNPENKPIRDRIHPGHAFRPPSEFPMPSQSFFECRHSSHWTYAEDDELRKLVKEYSYNWSLISSCVSPKSLFSSGPERRTPWECFERWVNLEGLPPDMAKTAYFRAYHQRLETAQRNVMAQQAAIQAQQGNNAAQPIRRRTTQPIRVDRRRSTKHLALLDGMRKLAKKRESALVKQQQGEQKKFDSGPKRPPIDPILKHLL
jgi:chromatin modification-related protein VID21